MNKIARSFFCTPQRNKFYFLLAFFISITPIITTGPKDVWAETFLEYFANVRSFADIKLHGWAGYFTLFPNMVAAFSGMFFERFMEPWFFSRFCSSLVLFLSSYLSFKIIGDNANNRESGFILSIIFLLFILVAAHPSLNSIITVGYFFYIPFVVFMVFYLTSQSEIQLPGLIKIMFIMGILTKPHLIFLMSLSIRGNRKFKIIALTAGIFQLYNLGPAVNPNDLSLFQYLLNLSIFTLTSIGSVFSYLFLFSELWWRKIVFLLPYLGVFLLLLVLFLTSRSKSFLTRFSSTFFVILLLFLSVSSLVFNPLADFHNPINSSSWLFFEHFKLQYRVIPVFCFSLTVFLLVSFENRKLLLGFFVLSLLVDVLSQLNASRSADVSSDVVMVDRIKSEGCAIVPPLPGWGIVSPETKYYLKDSLWVLGKSCKSEFLFDYYYDGKFFNLPSKAEHKLSLYDNFLYLIIIPNYNNELSIIDISKCRVLNKNSKIIIPKKHDAFGYISGSVRLDNPILPIDLLNRYEECFSVNGFRRQMNILVVKHN